MDQRLPHEPPDEGRSETMPAASPPEASGGSAATLGAVSHDADSLPLLEEAKAHWASSLLTESDFAVLVVETGGGRIVAATAAASSFYGYSIDELTALTLADLSADQSDLLADGIAQLRAAQRETLTARHRRRDGSVCHVEIQSSLPGTLDTDLAYCIIHDVTSWARAAADSDQRAHLGALLIEISTNLTSAQPEQLEHILECGVYRVAEAVGAHRISLWYRDGEDAMVCAHSYASPGVSVARGRLTRAQVPWLWEQLRAGTTIALTTVDDLPAEAHIDRRALAQFFLGSHTMVPLVRDGQLAAVLSCGSISEGVAWEGPTREALHVMVMLFAALNMRRETHRALTQRVRFEEVIAELATVFASRSPESLDLAIDRLLYGVVELLGCDRAALSEFSKGGQCLTSRWFQARSPECIVGPDALSNDTDPSWYKRSLLRGEAVVLTDAATQVPADGGYEDRWVRHHQVGSHLAIPITVDGAVTHVLAMETVGRLRDWPEDLRRRVSLIAGLIGKAIERQRAEVATQSLHNRLAHAARVAVTGELSAAFAHQMSQPLTAIASNAQATMLSLDSDNLDLAEFRETMVDIANDVSRAGQIIAHMRAHLRRSEPETERVRLTDAIDEVARVLATEARSRNVDFERAACSSCPVVSGDRVQLQQIVVNLVMNAFDALLVMPLNSRRVTVNCYAEGETAVVSVEDSGPGLPQEIGEDVFGPFVTTKPDGLGLGLTISRSIAQAHDGSLVAVALQGGGTRFELRLPSVETTR